MVRLMWRCLMVMALATTAVAGPADVETVTVLAGDNGTYRFRVTVRHADEGWSHCADRWEVLTLDGALLGTRTLYHPHVDEQPFTRELAGVSIPDTISAVVVRAHDSVHGFCGVTQTVVLPDR